MLLVLLAPPFQPFLSIRFDCQHAQIAIELLDRVIEDGLGLVLALRSCLRGFRCGRRYEDIRETFSDRGVFGGSV